MPLELLFIGPIGPLETVLIFLAVVILFGADRIPKLAKSMGASLSKFEEGKKEAKKEVEKIEGEVEESVNENSGDETTTEQDSENTTDE